MGQSTTRHSQNLVDKPEHIGPALAQVVSFSEGKDVILGQCWVAAPNQLVTCGHVVDRFVNDPSQVYVYFPSSGRRYGVHRISLHPSFVRQPDGLVKFDAAVLSVHLTPPDSLVLPLPFSYENTLSTKQALWTIRYPAHLGQLSAALEPLPQDGHFLGLLRKHDNFHLLHDVPLAPGDSGSPIIVGNLVVAMHCGDTATIPGLNLPMSSIRMALWVDAFRDLGLPETKRLYVPKASRIVKALSIFVITFIAGLAGMLYFSAKPPAKATPLIQPALMPVEVKFNEALDHYRVNEDVEIHLTPHSPCYPFLFLTDEAGHVVEIYPGYGNMEPLDYSVRVDRGNKGGEDNKSQLLQAADKRLKLYVVAVGANDEATTTWAKTKLVTEAEWLDRNVGALAVPETTLLARLNEFQKDKPGMVFWHVFDVPRPRN